MKTEDKEWGDLLAEDVIEKHKIALRKQPRPNYYIWPIKYVKTDAWISEKWWIDTGIELIEEEIDVISGLEIVLNAGKKEYMDKLIEIIGPLWNNKCETEYLYDLIALLPPDHSIRKKVFNYRYMEGINKDIRKRQAIMFVKDEKFCRYLSEKIINMIGDYLETDEYLLGDYIMPRMAEFGKSSKIYFEKHFLDNLKSKCFEVLRKDKGLIETGKECKLCEFRESISYWAWSLDWHDIMEFLKTSRWYMNCLPEIFFGDYNNENFLIWSHYIEDDFMRKKAIQMMESCILDGAIAWTRMRNLLRRSG
ncbi:hypothetical protein DENIS_1977 [Desulfonema ishimotonii]|uniref:Uncharacterized protein n=1 Tax=Desulfonema ishimotonii TaxID=45657 RepID=A0A401FVL0_9BACT|nr:hypothetical protein [Desulfonema ishimotonii]GBC61017.1 hypothetical protein DENIS_1977 [Desulfonema ishimotonii]